MFHLIQIIIYYVALKSTETFTIQKDNTTQQRQTYLTHNTLQQNKNKRQTPPHFTTRHVITTIQLHQTIFLPGGKNLEITGECYGPDITVSWPA